jgi:hypothetical protein
MNVRRVVTALASLLLMTLTIPAFASPRIVRLSYLAGDVRIDRNKAAGVEQAILNMPVVEGTRIYSVGDDARVEIEFENGSTMRLVGNGEIAFRQLGSIDNGNKQSVVEMVHGLAYFDVKNHDGDDFRVMLRDRDVTVRKSSHFRIDLEDPETTVAVFHGELELEGQAERVSVKKNETLSLESDDHSRYFLAKKITTLEGDSFDLERANYIASHAQSNVYEYAGVSYGSPYSYGLSDLAYYGSYSYYPGYGYLWRPAGFGIGWDPFAFGVWSYYSGPGWVFVSPYAWGWTPYRYGRWVNVPGRGWCWGPYGRIGSRGWYSVPVVYGSYPGRHINPGHGPIPVPWVRPPHETGGRSISIGGGGLNGRPEGFDRGIRQNPAFGPNGRPDGRGGRTGGPIPVPGVALNGTSSPSNGGLTVQGGALTSHGGPITTPGGAITTPGGAISTHGGAVKPVVPGTGREIGDNRDNGRDGNWSDRNRPGDHRVWQAPPVTNQAGGAPASSALSSPATPHEPMRRFDPPAVGGNPGRQPMSAPPVTAPAASVPTRPSAPAISMPAAAPMSHPAPPVTAPAAAPAGRPSAPAGRGIEVRPQGFSSGGGGRSKGGGAPHASAAPTSFRGNSGGGSPHFSGGGGHSSGGGGGSHSGGGGGHSSGGGGSHSSGGRGR